MWIMHSATRKTFFGSSRFVSLSQTSSPARSLPLKSGVAAVGAMAAGSAAKQIDALAESETMEREKRSIGKPSSRDRLGRECSGVSGHQPVRDCLPFHFGILGVSMRAPRRLTGGGARVGFGRPSFSG